VSAFEVQCVMPFLLVDIDVEFSSVTLEVSVSNDDKKFSNKMSIFIFDSKCQDCTTDTSTCRQKVPSTLY